MKELGSGVAFRIDEEQSTVWWHVSNVVRMSASPELGEKVRCMFYGITESASVEGLGSASINAVEGCSAKAEER